MEKRVIIAIVLCVGVIMAWTKLFPVRPAPPAPSATSAGAGEAALPPAGGAPLPAVGSSIRPERLIDLVTPEERFVFSSMGGTLAHAQLVQARFFDHPGDPATGHDVVREWDSRNTPLRTTFPSSAFETPADGAWEVTEPDGRTVVFAADSGTAHIEKRFTADTARYRLQLDVAITNRGDKPLDHHLAISMSGRQDPERRSGGFFSGSSANQSSMLCEVDDKIERRAVEKLGKDPIDKVGSVKWIGADEKFFLLAAVPYPEQPPAERRCVTQTLPNGAGEMMLSFAEHSVPPRGTLSYSFTIFAGPKVIADLDDVRPAGEDVKLDQSVDVSLAILSRPILSLLKFFHSFARNWGLAIILLTLFIKLVTFYPTQKSLLSAKKMQKLAPKMNAIRKKYENDRQRQSVETMNLYKAHGVSPFGGCLPSLIQMPIWIALYSTLNYAVELYRAPFVAHIHDLTAKDPYYITPLLMGSVMFLQMRMSPSGADQQQQATMSVMMPIMFTSFSLFLPSGLALYMLTSYLIGILQQLYVNYMDRKSSIA
jgi:YidC/Oxa1 family membrane protein insertase